MLEDSGGKNHEFRLTSDADSSLYCKEYEMHRQLLDIYIAI